MSIHKDNKLDRFRNRIDVDVPFEAVPKLVLSIIPVGGTSAPEEARVDTSARSPSKYYYGTLW